MKAAKLVLKSGESFHGQCPNWQDDNFFGEVVFNTGMVGYVESMTDPSYRGQLLAFTYPLIGNYGIADSATWESDNIQVAGIIVAHAEEFYTHRDAQQSLLTWCQANSIPLICDIDTRALAKSLSHKGVTAGAISCNDTAIKTFIDIDQQHFVKQASITKPIHYGDGKHTIIVVDCGIKKNILRHLQQYPINIKQVPFDYDFTNEEYDAVFVSNGPGNPEVCTETIAILKKVLTDDKPIFGICLGAQLIALAIGATTYKLPFGHRAQNHPCLHLASNQCVLTSQNHGYAIDEASLPDDWQVSFRHLNDNTVQGIAHKNKPFFAVQFHPEASPGPTDTAWLFNDFINAIK